jgi:hypothetical protein
MKVFHEKFIVSGPIQLQFRLTNYAHSQNQSDKSLTSFSHTSHHNVILTFEPTHEFRALCWHLFAYLFVSTMIHFKKSSEKKSSKRCRGETFEGNGTPFTSQWVHARNIPVPSVLMLK